MSKRKRDVRSEAAPAGRDAEPREQDGETDLPLAAPAPRREKPSRPPAGPQAGRAETFSLSTAAKENILLGVLSLYVLLLAFGTAGELFEVDWILELPLFK